MENNLIDKSDIFSTINYSEILKTINENVNNIEIKLEKNRINFCNLDTIINVMVEKLNKKNKSIINMLNIDNDKKPLDITIFYEDKDKFINEINSINKKIKSNIKKSLGENYKIPLTELLSYKENIERKNINFGLSYDFSNKKLSKQKVSFSKKEKAEERLRIDEVEIDILLKDIEKNVKENLINYMKNEDIDEDFLDERIEDIERGERGVSDVINLLNDQSLARIKRTVSYLYLNYLLENCDEKNTEIIYLKDYVRRFYILDEYLQQLNNEAEQNSIVSINGRDYNISNLLSKGDAFDCLPIIGIIDGTILEDRDEEKKKFKLAMKLKLNGVVQKEEKKNSYNYWMDFISNNEEKLEKRLRVFFMYSFMFYDLGNSNHNPVEKWKEVKEYIKKNGFNEDFINAFKMNPKVRNAENQVKSIKKILERVINYKTNALKKNSKDYIRRLILYKGIIADDIEGSSIFKNFDYNRTMLQYVSIVENEENINNILLSIPINIKISSNKLYEIGDSEETELTYDINNYKSIPIVFYPSALNPDKRKRFSQKIDSYYEELKENFYINIPYSIENKFFDKDKENFKYLYKIIYSNIVYMFIYNILDIYVKDDKKNTFIPMIRFHYGENKECDTFIRAISKTLEHLLSIDYRASSQGFNISKDKYVNFIYKNATSSLYSKIPKIFKDDVKYDVKKLAMIIVTSRKCDSIRNKPKNIMLIGEIILFDVLEDGSIKCDPYGTFGDNYSSEDIYYNPIVLNDVVGDLYKKGYSEILYIAKAPYTSKLNITSEDENLYFMNETVLETMSNEKNNLMIYPLYYQHFYAIDYKKSNKHALYVKDTKEIDYNLMNLNKAMAGVFNLYSGKSVGNNSEGKNYRSVILYSIICNKYKDKTLNAKLYKALIDNNTFKDNFTNFITLFHYSRYEADKDITIKMNPFDKLMDENGVVTNSVYKFEFENKKIIIRHNSLAYLLEVKKILDKEKAYGNK